MLGIFVKACVAAEVKRATRDHRDVDMDFLTKETGLQAYLIRSVIHHVEREIYEARFGPIKFGVGGGRRPVQLPAHGGL